MKKCVCVCVHTCVCMYGGEAERGKKAKEEENRKVEARNRKVVSIPLAIVSDIHNSEVHKLTVWLCVYPA